MLLLMFFVVCHAQPFTGRFVTELEQKTASPKLSFSIKPDRCPFSDIADINGFTKSSLPTNNIRQRSFIYGIKTTVELIFWQWHYITHLLVGYELILSTPDASLYSTPYSWALAEVVVAVGWLLQSYWHPNSPLFKLIEQQKATFMLTQGDQTFVTITVIPDSGHSQQQYQASQPSGQQAPGATIQPAGSFTGFLYSGSGSGDGEPLQHQHTLGLNCYVFPCNGVCSFRASSDSRESAEWPLNSLEISCPHFPQGHCLGCISHLNPLNVGDSTLSQALDDLFDTQLEFESGQLFQRQARQPQAGGISDNTDNHCTVNAGIVYATDTTWPANDDVPICLLPGGAPRGRTAHYPQTLANHKSSNHTGQLNCDVTTVVEDGEPQPCGKVFKSAQSLSSHKSKYHTGQKTCDVTVVREDGQQRCGIVFKSAQSLSSHKSKYHSGQKICDVTMFREDGQQQPCGTVCQNGYALSNHKRRYHTGKKACDMTVVGEDRQQRPCGKICRNALALSDHKKTQHGGEKTCDVTVVGEDGQQRPCGKVCQNTQALTNHKRKHRKRNPDDVSQNNDPSSKEGRVNK
ncbi:hypothetical protein [Endozoicomonas sp. SESOKO3]|uniref:hypothetical protein n=2 Tax=unclassified Endozoicomonas TaxID=2644528 RepID=UPI0021475AF4|nr:hypothetical protein [Endozoicomonas sp. SESOKO3]